MPLALGNSVALVEGEEGMIELPAPQHLTLRETANVKLG